MSGLIESLQHNPWDIYLGDCPVVTKYLNDKPLLSWKWSSIHVINIFLRAVGQVGSNNEALKAIELQKIFDLSNAHRIYKIVGPTPNIEPPHVSY